MGCTTTILTWLLPTAQFAYTSGSVQSLFPTSVASASPTQCPAHYQECVSPCGPKPQAHLEFYPQFRGPRPLDVNSVRSQSLFPALLWLCSPVRGGGSFISQMLSAFILNFEGQTWCLFSLWPCIFSHCSKEVYNRESPSQMEDVKLYLNCLLLGVLSQVGQSHLLPTPSQAKEVP